MVLYNIAQSLKLIDKGISESLVNKEKCPALIEACKIEIAYAKKHEKDEEKKKQIIETHEKQIATNQMVNAAISQNATNNPTESTGMEKAVFRKCLSSI